MNPKNKKVYTYVCKSCEDVIHTEEFVNDVHIHCECGGHLYLRKTNKFQRREDYTDCLICINKNTFECLDCTMFDQRGQ